MTIIVNDAFIQTGNTKFTNKMRELILVVHTSLDDFVAGAKGELDGFDAGEENLQSYAN